jgi:hypothetical protein
MNSERTVTKAVCSFWRNDCVSSKRKTDSWEVWSLDDGRHIGRVRWYSQWRRYCFFPSSGIACDPDCLRSIAQFLEGETAAHRKGKRAFREISA